MEFGSERSKSAKLAQTLLEARNFTRIAGCGARPYPADARHVASILRLGRPRCEQPSGRAAEPRAERAPFYLLD